MNGRTDSPLHTASPLSFTHSFSTLLWQEDIPSEPSPLHHQVFSLLFRLGTLSRELMAR